MRIRTVIPLLAIMALWVAMSCTTECNDNKTAIGLAGFYSSTTKAPIRLDSITVYGVGAPGDSAILRNQRQIVQVYLPMRINSDVTQYVFHYESKVISSVLYNDTLTLRYTAEPYFPSEECGAMYWYNIKDFSYTTHLIDSVAIPTMRITNSDIETIEIYMRTNN